MMMMKDAVLVIFPDLEYEFIYEIDYEQRYIRLINCEKMVTLFDKARDVRVEI
jgi:hypothetical protein